MLDTFPATVPAPSPTRFLPTSPNAEFSPALPFALTTPDGNPAAAMSGAARPVVLDRFATLVEAMQGAVACAGAIAHLVAPQMLAIVDREDRLVLAGSASAGSVAWCHPVTTASEARAVVTEASALRAQAGRAIDWQEPDLAARLRHRADCLEGRLVDPLWRSFAARALHLAA